MLSEDSARVSEVPIIKMPFNVSWKTRLVIYGSAPSLMEVHIVMMEKPLPTWLLKE